MWSENRNIDNPAGGNEQEMLNLSVYKSVMSEKEKSLEKMKAEYSDSEDMPLNVLISTKNLSSRNSVVNISSTNESISQRRMENQDSDSDSELPLSQIRRKLTTKREDRGESRDPKPVEKEASVEKYDITNSTNGGETLFFKEISEKLMRSATGGSKSDFVYERSMERRIEKKKPTINIKLMLAKEEEKDEKMRSEFVKRRLKSGEVAEVVKELEGVKEKDIGAEISRIIFEIKLEENGDLVRENNIEEAAETVGTMWGRENSGDKRTDEQLRRKVRERVRCDFRVYIGDEKKYYNVAVAQDTTSGQLVQEMCRVGIVKQENCVLYERTGKYGIERVLRNWEKVGQVVERFENREGNYLVAKKHEGAEILELEQVKKADIVFEGELYYKGPKGKWVKGDFILENNVIYQNKKGVKSVYKGLENFDVGEIYQQRKGMATGYGFCLKSELSITMYEKPEEDYVKEFNVETAQESVEWIKAIYDSKSQVMLVKYLNSAMHQAEESDINEVENGYGAEMGGRRERIENPLVDISKITGMEGRGGKSYGLGIERQRQKGVVDVGDIKNILERQGGRVKENDIGAFDMSKYGGKIQKVPRGGVGDQRRVKNNNYSQAVERSNTRPRYQQDPRWEEERKSHSFSWILKS
ncbi:hypothetical protein AX774_g6819 [Zancudomyces culisetae]|uniref:PH domain-containing protein n=1 Tax=Zancudomyces culisetae TaxID=1213189 RepID=A0A1R1PFK1_ZANCU|nr:hypothetical protein AX774_g6819 [Zancudomyces culisetae]|eukprot:OMH79764.1 hypothetical protein AX774_g6819 [Zancudomyces culisetae]